MNPSLTMSDLERSLVGGEFWDALDALDHLVHWMSMGGDPRNLRSVEIPKRPIPIPVKDAIDVYNQTLTKCQGGVNDCDP